jgi:nucleoside-diphosphate-sugar epimerase
MTQSVLILGATGRLGRHAVTAFSKAGWQVRTFDRNTDTLEEKSRGADVIVNGWNPVYTRWQRDVPKLTDRVIAAARHSGATVIVPGNVYVFGAAAPAILCADTPHHARNPLGHIRIAMEQAYRRAGVKTIVLRAGDFLDTQASGSWFDMILTKQLASGIFTYPGALDVPHAWAFLPDLARAMVTLAQKRDTLADFTDLPFPGYTVSGLEMQAVLEQITGQDLNLKKMNWLPIKLAAPVWKMGRALLEMQYLWSRPHQLDGAQFAALLPGFEPTPLSRALAHSLRCNINPDQPVIGAKATV